MVQEKKRHPRRSDQEWMDLIQDCRTSGMTDKAWCEEHGIQTSKFYYHIRRLRGKACVIPENALVPARQEHHEMVSIHFPEADSLQTMEEPVRNAAGFYDDQTAIRLSFHGASLEITNHAAGGTIAAVLAALEEIC